MPLTIIIVNYKTPWLTIDCISSVYAYEGDKNDLEIIVADNDSQDGIEAMLKQRFPAVRFLQLGYNAGFARANNAAIKIATGDVFLLLNSDTIAEENAIGKCYSVFKSSAYAACGIQLLNEDRTPQVSGLYAVKGGLNFLLQLPYVGNMLTFIANTFKVKKPNVPVAEGTVEVDWINGAFLMVKRQATEKAGLLDEDFFLYAEEAEWCSRLKKTGKLCVYGGLHMIHLQGESAMSTFGSEDRAYKNIYDKKGLQIMLSTFVRIRKEFGALWFLFILSAFILEIPIFFIGVLLTVLFSRKSAYTFEHFRGYVKNVITITRMAAIIVRNRPYFYKVL